MASRGWSRARTAESLGCDVSVLRRWIKGQRTPSTHNAARIEALFSIASRAWSEPAIEGRVAA
jgi:ribosome-binding protein aMBF1 (putative translation factor)